MTVRVKARWDHALLVCRKCSRRTGKRFGLGGDESLAKALRRNPGYGKSRKAEVGVVEVGCLKLCPKQGVAVVDTREPGRWHVVHPGEEAALAAERPDDPA